MVHRLLRPMPITLALLALLIVGGILVLLRPAPRQSYVAERLAAAELRAGWEYRWGDSPLDGAGQPLWASAADGWAPLPRLGWPPDHAGQTNLWLRIRLPAGAWRDPALFLDQTGQRFEAYVAGRRIYRYGDFDAAGQAPFAGWATHLIPLPADFQGRFLTLRIYSDFVTFGIPNFALVDAQAVQLSNLIRNELDNVVIAASYIMLALMGLVFFIRNPRQPIFFWFMLSTLTGGLTLLNLGSVKQVLIDSPEFWFFIRRSCQPLSILGMAFFMEQLWGSGYRQIFRRMGQLWLVLSIINTGLRISATNIAFIDDRLFLILGGGSMLVLLGMAIINAIGGNSEARILTVGIGSQLISAVYFIVTASGGRTPSPHVPSAGAFVGLCATVIVLVNRFLRTHRQLDAYAQELDIARRTQQQLLPQSMPGWRGIDLACASLPAREVGGDLYVYHDFAPGQPGVSRRYAVAVGDVTGKGMPAALLMATTLASFRSLIDINQAPADLMARLDHSISLYTQASRQNCGLVYAEITMQDGAATLRACNAGGIAPLVRHGSGRLEWIEVGGLPLGAGLQLKPAYREVLCPISHGDQVILLSDGIVEAMNSAGEMFGFERLEQTVAGGPPTSAAMLGHIQRAVSSFVGASESNDDQTLVVVQI